MTAKHLRIARTLVICFASIFEASSIFAQPLRLVQPSPKLIERAGSVTPDCNSVPPSRIECVIAPSESGPYLIQAESRIESGKHPSKPSRAKFSAAMNIAFGEVISDYFPTYACDSAEDSSSYNTGFSLDAACIVSLTKGKKYFVAVEAGGGPGLTGKVSPKNLIISNLRARVDPRTGLACTDLPRSHSQHCLFIASASGAAHFSTSARVGWTGHGDGAVYAIAGFAIALDPTIPLQDMPMCGSQQTNGGTNNHFTARLNDCKYIGVVEPKTELKFKSISAGTRISDVGLEGVTAKVLAGK